MRTAVYVTVDTETSMGGAWDHADRRPLPVARRVFGRAHDGDHGLPLIVDALSRRGMRGTFLVETLASHVIGEGETRAVTDFLLARGQDVQLHAHPTYRHYRDHLRRVAAGRARGAPRTTDQLCLHEEAEQVDLLADAVGIFERLTGRRPTAFRAGGFAADRATLRALRRVGIVLDSSWNPHFRFANRSFRDDPPPVNRPDLVEGVWELPVAVAGVGGEEDRHLKHADPSAISAAEMAAVVDQAHAAGMRHVVTILHCFSTVKPRDAVYSEVRPNRIVIARLRAFLDHLAAHPDRFEVRTLGDAAADPAALAAPQPAVVPRLGLVRPATRKLVQAVNNVYWV